MNDVISYRALLRADGERIDAWFDSVAAEAPTRPDLEVVFCEIELAVKNHLVTEESTLIPLVAERSPRDARVIMEEHRFLRRRLEEVRLAVSLRALKELREELAAHERVEAAIYARVLEGWTTT